MVGQYWLTNLDMTIRLTTYLICLILMASCSSGSAEPEVKPSAVMVVDELVPDYGPPGTEVTIKGNNFSTVLSENTVKFGDTQVEIISASKIELKVIAPDMPVGDVPVYVSSKGKTIKKDFYFLAPLPPEAEPRYPQTDAGRVLDGVTCLKITDVLWDTTYTVTAGVDYYQMKIVTDAKEKQDVYLIRTDLSQGLDIKVSLPSTTTSSSWKKQTLTEMTKKMTTSSKPVYAMINGDFWNMTSPINPRGPVHCSGKVWSSSWDYDPKVSQQALSFVGVKSDGKMLIDEKSAYSGMKSSLKECTGSGVIMLLDGQIQPISYPNRDPRTAIGYTSNNLIWMLTVDGRHGTSGMTYQEMASIFHSLGCEAAANLDGGGSAQMLIRNPKTLKHEICNWPSDPTEGDGGKERSVINGWAIVKK